MSLALLVAIAHIVTVAASGQCTKNTNIKFDWQAEKTVISKPGELYDNGKAANTKQIISLKSGFVGLRFMCAVGEGQTIIGLQYNPMTKDQPWATSEYGVGCNAGGTGKISLYEYTFIKNKNQWKEDGARRDKKDGSTSYPDTRGKFWEITINDDGFVEYAVYDGPNDSRRVSYTSKKKVTGDLKIVAHQYHPGTRLTQAQYVCGAPKCKATQYIKDDKCADCPAGSICDSKKPTACAKDNYVKENKCVSCPPFHTCDGAKAIRTPCTLANLGSIALDDSNIKAKINMEGTKQNDIEVNGLAYKYHGCVDPGTVSFEAYEKNKLGYCDVGKSLSNIVKIEGTPGSESALMILKIDYSKVSTLGAAYSETDGKVTLSMCVRARVKEDKVDILFTETNFVIQYTARAGFFSIKVSADRTSNEQVNKDIGSLSKITAFHCDENYKKLDALTITQASPILRVCVQGESDKFECQHVIKATLTQAGNGIEDKLIVDKKIQTAFAKYTEVKKTKQTCMLGVLLSAKYFQKKTANSDLKVTVEGTVDMPPKSRRLLNDVDPERRLEAKPRAARFLLSADVMETDKQMVRRDTAAAGVYSIAAGTTVITAMLM